MSIYTRLPGAVLNMLLTEMKLPEIDIYSSEYLDDPHALMAELEKSPEPLYTHVYMLMGHQ